MILRSLFIYNISIIVFLSISLKVYFLVKNLSILSDDMLVTVLGELPPLVNENDLHIAQLTLTLMTSVVSTHPSSIQFISKSSLPQVEIYLSKRVYVTSKISERLLGTSNHSISHKKYNSILQTKKK